MAQKIPLPKNKTTPVIIPTIILSDKNIAVMNEIINNGIQIPWDLYFACFVILPNASMDMITAAQ